MDKYVIDDFYLNLPKIELHAHITGCVRKSTLLDLASKYNVQNDKSDDNYYYNTLKKNTP